MWQVYKLKMDEAMKCIPMKVVTDGPGRQGKKFTPLDRKTLSKIKRKERLWKRYCQTNDGQIYLEYSRLSNQIRSATRKAQKNVEKNVARKAKSNPKKFWQYVNSKTKSKPSIPDLFIGDDDGTTDKSRTTGSDKEAADLFNKYFIRGVWLIFAIIMISGQYMEYPAK